MRIPKFVERGMKIKKKEIAKILKILQTTINNEDEKEILLDYLSTQGYWEGTREHMGYMDDYLRDLGKDKKESKIEIIMEWQTNRNTYKGVLKDWTASEYILERIDTKEHVTMPRICCRAIGVIEI